MEYYIILLIILLLLVLVYTRQTRVEGFEGPSKLEEQLSALQKKNIDLKSSITSKDDVLKQYIEEAQVNMKYQITHLLHNSIPSMFSNPTLGNIDFTKLNVVKELIETNDILEKSKQYVGTAYTNLGDKGMSGGFGKNTKAENQKSTDKEGGGGMLGNMFG